MHEGAQEYAARMRTLPQFRYFGIEPVWKPGTKDIEGFCHDEVVRQFHDTGVEGDGGQRVRWLLDAWAYATANDDRSPDVQDVLLLGSLIEPSQNSPSAFRSMGVTIGGRLGATPRAVPSLMARLCQRTSDVEIGPGDSRLLARLDRLGELLFEEEVSEIETIDEWYLCFQWIHPFADGNGRSGKVLHNWLSRTLEDPVLVPDYFGGGNP